MTVNTSSTYSARDETHRLLKVVASTVDLPAEVQSLLKEVHFKVHQDLPYLPIPLKETELGAVLKAIEGCVIGALAGVTKSPVIDLQHATAFLCQTYLSSVDGHGKLDKVSKKYLKDTDLLQAQSNPYRRLSANLYKTRLPGEYYHIHGSLEASTTLRMLGLEPFRPDLSEHNEIIHCIEKNVRPFSNEELDVLNNKHGQAGVAALKYDEFKRTQHGKAALTQPPWSVVELERQTPPVACNPDKAGRPLASIKVLELTRVIAGPTMGRILAEYGAEVLKITSPKLSDVPFFQIDSNMGKHTADLDLKSTEDRKIFEKLLADADVILDGYRPGSLDRLGYGAEALSKLAIQRKKGYVYVNENCFGYEGEWAGRPGWQQIADCVSGVAWAQGIFMGLNEPVVPPFPISDYGTGCMGAIAALLGLLHRAKDGGSWHGKTSLLQYDLLLFKAGEYPPEVLESLRSDLSVEFAGLRYHNSVDQISGAALSMLETKYPAIFKSDAVLQKSYSKGFKGELQTVKPVVQLEGVNNSFKRSSRPNGFDKPSWDFSDCDAELDEHINR